MDIEATSLNHAFTLLSLRLLKLTDFATVAMFFDKDS